MALKTDYSDDIFEGNRKYKINQDAEGKYEILDSTNYTKVGDTFSAEDINATNTAINNLASTKNFILLASNWSNTAPFTQEVAVAGVKSSDSSVVGLDTSNHINNAQYVRLMKKAWSCVDRIESLEGKIRAYCANKKPVADIYLTAKGV